MIRDQSEARRCHPDYLPFAQWLKERMADRGLTVADLAERMGSIRYRHRIAEFLCAVETPVGAEIPKLASALGVDSIPPLPEPVPVPVAKDGPPDFTIEMNPDRPGVLTLRINTVLTDLHFDAAVGVIDAINEARRGGQ